MTGFDPNKINPLSREGIVPKGNHSILSEDMKKDPKIANTYHPALFGNKNDTAEYWKLRKAPELQFVVAQIAGMVIPVAPMFRKSKKLFGLFPGETFSKDITDRRDHASSLENEALIESNRIILFSIFGDPDRSQKSSTRENQYGGIYYDFDQANFGENSKHPKQMTEGKVSTWISDLKLEYPPNLFEELKQTLKEKVSFLKNHLNGDDGLKFLNAVVQKANYKDYSASELQTILLYRCNKLLTALEQ